MSDLGHPVRLPVSRHKLKKGGEPVVGIERVKVRSPNLLRKVSTVSGKDIKIRLPKPPTGLAEISPLSLDNKLLKSHD